MAPYLYPAAALYPGGSLASYNPVNYDGSNDNRGESNPNGSLSSGNVEGNSSESPVTSVGRVRTGASSVGSDGDLSTTLSPRNGSSRIRENQDGVHSTENPSGRGIDSSAVLSRWEESNGAMTAALEAVVGRNARGTIEQHVDQMARASSLHPAGPLHEDVWRPYWITPSTT